MNRFVVLSFFVLGPLLLGDGAVAQSDNPAVAVFIPPEPAKPLKPDISMILTRYSHPHLITQSTALVVAQQAIEEAYGKEELSRQLPLKIRDGGERWIIEGSRKTGAPALEGGDILQGPVVVEIAKADCQILKLTGTVSIERKVLHVPNETEFVKIIVDYVIAHKGWVPDKDFVVMLEDQEDKKLIFTVLYVHDKFEGPGGGGKSFLAVFDPGTKRVEQELAFQ